MSTTRQRGIIYRLFRSIFMIFTGYFALLGVLVTVFTLLIGFGIYKSLADQQKAPKAKTVQVSPELDAALLKITIDRPISEDALSERDRILSQIFARDLPISLREIETTLRRAAADERVVGVLLDIENGGGAFSTVTSLRKALVEFSASKKPLYVHLNEGDTLLYYLASTANKINLAPVSGLTIPGPAFQLTYFSSALKKLGVEMEVVRAGKYKSAMEPFVLDGPSAETTEMYGAMEASLRGTLVDAIAEGRKKPKDQVEAWFRRSLYTSQQSLQNGLVDRLGYLPEWIDELKAEAKAKNLMESDKYLAESGDIDDARTASGTNEPALALIEASGEITMSSGDGGEGIVPDDLIKELRWAVEKEDVKAVVFRIDSPGGSALASDLIWDEVRKLSAVKPVVVSMGAVAASGGYYIAAPATMIVAEPTTITGSIGVIGAALKGLTVADKWGVNFHTITQSDRRNYLNFGTRMSEQDRQIIGESIDETYNAFVTKVANGRKKDPAQIFALAQGRVYTGLEASRIGLVDKLGGLKDAIREAKILAKMDPEKLYPLERYRAEPETLVECLMQGSALDCLNSFGVGVMSAATARSIDKRLPISELKKLDAMLEASPVLAYWPGEVRWTTRGE